MKKGSFVIMGFVLMCIIIAMGCKKNDTTQQAPVPDVVSVPAAKTTLIALFSMANYSTPSQVQLLDSQYNAATNINTQSAVVNFQKWNINGQVRYSYNLFDPTTPVIAGVGYIPGTTLIFDENMKELKRVRLLPHNARTAEAPVDGHEFILIDDDHYIAMAYLQETPGNIDASLNPATNCMVVTPVIQEVQNGQVIWEWKGADHPEFYANSVEGNDFGNTAAAQDYMHLNSMFIDPKDNNLVCSFRNQNQVVKIDRKTGDIIWRLGGKNSDFPLPATQKFLRQHDATITSNGTILMMDNGDANERPYSRVAEFTLNEGAKTITSYKSLDLPNNLFCQYMGSVQKTANTYFIGCGSVPQIMEINYNTGEVLMSKIIAGTSYRALRY